MTTEQQEFCRQHLDSMMDEPFDGGVMGIVYGLCISTEYAVCRSIRDQDIPFLGYDRIDAGEIHKLVREYCEENEIEDDEAEIRRHIEEMHQDIIRRQAGENA